MANKKSEMSIDDLFEKFGGPAAMGRALGVPPSTASEMRRRRSIPVRYWPALIEKAPEHKIAGIDAETLMRIHVHDRALAG